MVWDHKTAPSIEIGTELAHKKPQAHPREGKSGIGLTNVEFDSTEVMSILRRSARCHPERPALTPQGLCAGCALDWYVRHRRDIP